MFYDKYAQLCKRRGVSMSAAALEAGLSKSLVTKWKTNRTEAPSPEVLKKLSDFFGVTPNELLGYEKSNSCRQGQQDGKELKNMAAKEFLTDEQVEQEIERLRESPLVALARREARLKYRRRQYLYQLRDLEKKGKSLEKAGITMEVLNAMYELGDYDDPC